ncbi:efflux RND transporter periplasmic adaptor subunit [Oceanisphaera arctica]|uniref:Efflux transporter periplasmic adaptor subunit n=1 Tax=Oceanisphaera arctica TaxID=641510 RepID=A0A2P5TK19_9GAMM|nr:efflux RND transporter periplasmic adaptor subunit [Oceanisphaera arctica]PPL15431.1 efflux transporter periplasmic adaptor subunit [Oceanisphaera arctica]GHA22443.1 MexH family multidrug efflux RND transporter periplasmic adaptor subunit [Oceanisphaera arctica]
MPKKLLWAGVGLLVVLPIVAVLVLIKLAQFNAMAQAGEQQQMPPEPVNMIEVREERWQPVIRAVGSVVAVQGALLRIEAEGIVRDISFESGARVEAGNVLLRLDAELEQAQLREALSVAALARLSFRRGQQLRKSGSISRSEFDQVAANLKQSDARVDFFRALINRKTLRAPFTGQLGIRQISRGQFLDKGSAVVSLQSLDPVYVDFSLPQQRLAELSAGLSVTVSSDSYPDQPFAGKVSAFNPEIDAVTRSARAQATLVNPDDRLRPGMFVSVEMQLARSESVLLVPQTAVVHGPGGDAVFVLEEDAQGSDGASSLVVQLRPVRLGVRRGDFVAVTEGLAVDERVVSTGVFKLRPGMAVVIDNRLAPDFKLDPQPGNS